MKALTITCETYDARISFGTAAVQSASVPVGHILAATSSMRIPSYSLLTSAYVISKTSGEAASLQITLEY